MKSTGLWTAMLMLATAVGYTAPAKEKGTGLRDLGPGAYQATVKAIVCDGCGEFIQKAKLVTFRVNDGATVKLGDLQKTLKASAAEMGMGADYTLHNVKKVAEATGVTDTQEAPRDPHQGHQH